MMGYGFGMGAGGWIAMAVFWVGVIGLLVWLVARAFPGGRRDDVAPGGHPGAGQGETPEQILDRRFASGEIDAATYESMRATLRAGRTGK